VRIKVLYSVASFLDDLVDDFPGVDVVVKVMDGDDVDVFYTAEGRVLVTEGGEDASSEWYEKFGERSSDFGDDTGECD